MFPCPICDVKLNSAEQRRAHCRGKNHIKREEARKKSEELGTDFDNTPDHCQVCDVPLTSKMTAIDHFKGKMHQKKVKAVEDQRQGYINYCDICEVRLQSLKVSEAHFQGKQHCKRQRKTNSGKNQTKRNTLDRKSNNSRVSRQKQQDFPMSPNFFNGDFQESARNSWENLNCDIEAEPKDLLSEFRSFLSGKSLYESADSQSSSSPESSKEAFFSFEIDKPLHESIIPDKSLETPLQNVSFYNIHDTALIEETGSLWQPNCDKKRSLQPFFYPEPTTQNGVLAQSEVIIHTQAVLCVLKEAEGEGISSGDIAVKIAGLSPSDVNVILADLEKHHFVSKSGYAPILWSLTTSHSSKQTNGCNEKIPSPKKPQLLKKDSYFNGHLPTSEPSATSAILSSSLISTTASSKSFPPVIEANLVNLFQQTGSLTIHEIQRKLEFRDNVTLDLILQNFVERNILVKDGDQRWRLASATRSNVGVIGEERKRRSPEIRRTPTPPKENDHVVANCEPLLLNGDRHNRFWHELNHYGKVVQNSNQLNNNKQQNRCSPPLNNKTMIKHNPLALKTETSEVLEDLTVTTPKVYQKELYEVAMQEDTVCYLPCGTGKDLVMAQVIAHMAILNPTKQALVVVSDIVRALNIAQVLRKEFGSKSKRKKLNVALHAEQLKQSNGKVQVAVVTSSTCLSLLNCGALSWRDVCLLIFDEATMCCNDEPSKKILHEYYLKAKMDCLDAPKLLSFFDSSAGEENLENTVKKFSNVLVTMGDVFLSCVSTSVSELEQDKREAMFVCVQAGLTEEESRMFFLLGTYLNLVFDNLAAQWRPLNSYRELLKISFKENSVISEAFVKLIRLTGQPLEKRLPPSCLKTWRHYLAICEVIFTLVECGKDVATELLVNLRREQFGFAWANDIGLPGIELSQQLTETEITNWGSNLSRGSGVRELLEQLMIIQWENARVSSERPLALVIVKLSKTAKVLANYLSRCQELVKRNVKTTFVDGSRSHQQKAVISAIKRRQYQVIVSTDNVDDELPHCELVVLLDQPSSEYALEQLRTRRATNVVAICRDVDGEAKLKELLRQEELVEETVAIIRSGRC